MRASPILLAALVAAATVSAEPLSRTENVLWVDCTVTLYDRTDPSILDAVFARLHDLHHGLSVNIPGSELDAVSDAAGRDPVRVSSDVLAVIARGLELSALSNGLFDPTVGPLMKVWNMNTANGHVPEPADLARARALVNWRDIVMDRAAGTIYLRRPGMRLDAGALLKGYAADEVVRILTARGVKSAMVNLGGNIFAVGRKPDGQEWQIGIQDPDAERGDLLGVISVADRTVVTSGIYEHYFLQNGKRYHHIMDTRTGFPVDNDVTADTIIAGRSIDADGIATTVICLGAVEGLAFARTMGVDAIIVTADHRLYLTDGARKMLTVTNPDFTPAAR